MLRPIALSDAADTYGYAGDRIVNALTRSTS
jgi:hypothetical protein